jgi:hypothetical protein
MYAKRIALKPKGRPNNGHCSLCCQLVPIRTPFQLVRQSFRFELKNFPAGNLISSTGLSIALQARPKPAKWLPELLRVRFKPELMSERVRAAETFNQRNR